MADETPEAQDVVVHVTRNTSSPSDETLQEQVLAARAGRERAHANIERLEEATRAREAFLNELAHELRTPLTAILGWASLLRVRQFDPEAVARGLAAIEQSAREQAQLIDDLSDLSRVASGKLRLEMRPMDLASAVRAALEAVRPSAHAKGVRLEESLAGSDFSVRGDGHRLRQVVGNLLTNAVKFTPAGGTVTVSLERPQGHVRLTVRDTGVGIPASFLPYVFDRFRQADGGAARTEGGLGLGMAIVRHLVELHGGQVTAESAGEGMGASFTMDLPVSAIAAAVETESAPVDDAAAGPRSVLAGVRLLLVEDDAPSRSAITALLEEAGAEVLGASSVDEALRAVTERRPDVVVSDIRMPGHDGFELIRELRARNAGSAEQIPAVALTGWGREADRRRALSEGFQLYMAKPVDGSALANAVAGLVAVPVGEAASQRT
ncbi:MAG: hybrid sensor histidine kinase/response regulator [Acidobacteria bacterium]|nr:hybrid sensor histidine kinase/response regulator [Acidobacteriota bacterium]